ncbi:uncharacterized protein LOC106660542 [Trichogramma pretiosum]|uniref:uncharacterized protein LOC106660542 n=1 Tax=Trichogramma pretiosum TaxID=7493 RepID=UPI0006C9796A|nr:uncharacterized protein LOC106660542 [Trichogramma pretiosum]
MCTSISVVSRRCTGRRYPTSMMTLDRIFMNPKFKHNSRSLCSWIGSCTPKSNSYNLSFSHQQRYGSASAGVTAGAIHRILSKTQAKELAVRLTSEEREVLITALQECQSNKLKAEFEGQLAAFRWRSKFGRPSKVPSLGDVDPTGSYCEVPDDWLLRKYAESVPQPTRADLMRVAVANAIPFIGFGFLDNLVMIIAGDSIEASLGSFITLSTMAAAAFGNTISDILGIGSAVYVERLAQKIGFEPPKLTPMQLNLPMCRRSANFGRVLGVTIGCIIGMLPLLVIDAKDKNTEEKDKNTEVKDKNTEENIKIQK